MSMNLQQQAAGMPRYNLPPPMMPRMNSVKPVDNYRPPAVWQNSLPRNTVILNKAVTQLSIHLNTHISVAIEDCEWW